MIVNNVHVQALLFATPAFVVFIAFCWRQVKKKEWEDWFGVIVSLFFLIFPISCLGIGYLLERSMVWTVVYACCAVVTGGLVLIYSIFSDFGSDGGVAVLCDIPACAAAGPTRH